ncbi:MAG: CoA transferase [Rubrivivax sp.]
MVKVEKPGEGDDTRRMGPFLRDATGHPTDESATFLAHNRGKRSVAIDISRPAGADLVRRLARASDAVIDNYKVGNLAKYGLDAATLRAADPRLVTCSITGFGADGPYAPRAAYDFVMQGMSGLMSTCGLPDGPPMRTGAPITDLFTGLYAAIALLAALMHQQRSGEGQHVDLAMLDAAVAVTGHLGLTHLLGGVPQRQGNRNPIAVPAGVYRVRDGQCIVTCGNDGQWRALARAIGRPQWAEDPTLATLALRRPRIDELDAMLGEVLHGWTQAELLAALEKAGVPAGPIHAMDDVFADPQVKHRGIALKLPHGRGTDVPSLRSPLRLPASPVRHVAPPMLGQHTDEVLRTRLGLDDAALAALRADGVIA